MKKLYCFSPPVMVATMLIEFGGAVFYWWRTKLNQVGRVGIAMLIGLGIFQFAEYMICATASVNNFWWARMGHAAISVLPAIGIHLILNIANKHRWFIGWLYLLPLFYVLYFLFTPQAITSESCGGNYIMFSSPVYYTPYYGVYYYGFILAMMVLSYRLGKKASLKRVKTALGWMIIGCLSFLIPTATATFLIPELIYGHASVLCGFAVFFAVVIIGRIIPLVGLEVENQKTPERES